jgi:hypothetical protein
MLKIAFVSLFSFIIFQGFSQNYVLKGIISDIDTKDPLPFVNISIDNSRRGMVSLIDGTFSVEVNSVNRTLTFSFVGYETYHLLISSLTDYSNIQINLKRKYVEISEVVIKPGENPAHRIIIKVLENKDINNPEKMHSFSYTAYNKLYFTVTEDTFAKGKQLPLIIDSLEKDPSEVRLKKFLERQHFFLCEFVSERYFKHPEKNYEKVISSRVSGLSDPTFILLATQMQSFSIYNEYLTIFEKRYINPISNGATSRYFFLLEDTFYNERNDTIFVISYRPAKGKNFEGLSGILYINSNRYAVQNIIAEPVLVEPTLAVRIQQQYDFIDNKQWFPTQLNTDILFRNTKIETKTRKHFLTAVGKSFLTNINIEPDISKINFTSTELEVQDHATKQDEKFWEQNRAIPLDKKDSATYHIVDSVGKRMQLDEKMLLLEAMLYGYIPVGGFNIDMKKFVGYNRFEGLRLGLGLSTNPKVMSFASLGGFFTYGIHDKNWKYSGFLQIFPKWYSDTKATLYYAKNVTETGGMGYLDDFTLNSSEFLRDYYISKMDKAEDMAVSLGFRTLQYFRFNIYIKQTHKIFDNYTFQFAPTNSTIKNLTFTEAGVQLKFAYNEKFMKTTGGRKISLGTRYPVLWFNYRKGLKLLDGEIEYAKYESKISETFYTKTFGKTQIQVKGGKIAGDLPLSDVYDALGCYEPISVDVENYFNTIRPAEFYSDEFIYIFLRQNFGRLLFKGEKFKPEIILVSNAGWGTLSNVAKHGGINFSTMEKGFFESGLLFGKLYTSKFFSFGLGTYYRYGNYAFSKTVDNFAFKIIFGSSF